MFPLLIKYDKKMKEGESVQWHLQNFCVGSISCLGRQRRRRTSSRRRTDLFLSRHVRHSQGNFLNNLRRCWTNWEKAIISRGGKKAGSQRAAGRRHFGRLGCGYGVVPERWVYAGGDLCEGRQRLPLPIFFCFLVFMVDPPNSVSQQMKHCGPTPKMFGHQLYEYSNLMPI